jgi:EmrB/QacA subfamily drug resistance transporter
MAAAPPAPPGAWTPPDERTYARRWWVLAILCTSLVIVVVGNTTLNVALPTLARDVADGGLGASQTQLQWIVDAYALVFAGLLLTAGALGDRFGRKGALQIGLVVFAVASAAAGFSDSSGRLIALRAVMGAAAAFIMPSTLSILTNVFPPQERAKAISIWAGLSGAGAAIGPVASGFLLRHYWWGSVFLVNLPIIAFALIAGRVLVPRSKDPEEGRLDPVGAVLSIIGLAVLLYAIIEAPNHGWASAETLGLFVAAFVVLAAFLAWEWRSKEPMLDLRLFRNPRFGVASGGITLVFFAMFGLFFLISQYFQLVLGYSPLGAAVRQLPVSVVIVALAPRAPRLVARHGVNRVVAAGLGLVAVGLVLNSTWGVDTPYWQIVASLCVVAAGMALTTSPLTASIMSSVPLGRAGVGSATNDTTRELGGALGVAVLGSLLASRYTSAVDGVAGLPAATRGVAEGSLGGALQVANRLPGDAGRTLAAAAQQGYVDGMHLAMWVAAGIAALAAVLVLKFLPGHVTSPSEVPADAQGGEHFPSPAR